MRICRVKGTVVATARHPSLDGHKTLICQPLDEHGRDLGTPVIAIDRVQAGVGDLVLVHDEGNGARQMLGAAITEPVPIRTVVVGIVDEIAARTQA